ncbi:MAG: class A beta-lactamase [Gemmatimonadetes bacterium]|nr:class A beta-lactamase [Gemmatimonadota bacterium]
MDTKSPLRSRLALLASAALAGLWMALGAPASVAQSTELTGNDPGLEYLAAEVERLAENARGTVGVAAYHLETGRGFTLNGDVRFPMASTYKVPIAVQILSMVDRGELSLYDMIELAEDDIYLTASAISDLLDDPGVQLSIHNLLELMLQISDNIATDVLFREAGGAAAITGRMADAGIEGIRVDRTTWALIANWLGRPDVTVEGGIHPDEFRKLLEAERTQEDLAANNRTFNADPRDTATPAAMASLLRKVWEGEVLSEESSRLLIDIMYRCRTGEARLKGALPPGTAVAHKTGTIGETTNDVGIIDLPGDAGHVVTVVYIRESKLEDNAAMEPVIAQIARAVHDYFVFNPRGNLGS